MNTLNHNHFWHYKTLSPQAKTVVDHMLKAGSITQREAILDHSIQSLTRRITEICDSGIHIIREDKKHPVTQQRYARYAIQPRSLEQA